MPEILEPRYDHQKEEKEIYDLWEKSGYFNPDNLPSRQSKGQIANSKSPSKKPRAISNKPFAIIMPPPNANGSLHVGHAFEAAIQDLIIRYFRMRGRKTLWLPGADHAGFETQVVFEKKLDKEGRNRFEIPRDQLFKEIWDFIQSNKKIMESQFKKLGASCDWSREKFTLDPDIVKIVYETFGKLHKDKLLYRDLRIVNWCPKHRTALSDLEVKHEERQDPLYYIKYGPLTIATVRPETKFGDTALAVNPKDKRYSKYIGEEIEAKGILGPLKFKVIADEAIDPKFGTGVVKVTPAHDPADFEIWQRHKKEIQGPKIIIGENGRLTGDAGQFAGLKVAEARIKVVEAMKKIDILEKIENDYKHQVTICYKCQNTLEPLPKMQWWVKMKPLAEKAIKAAEKKQITFRPENSKKVYLHWLKNIRDWNISRQIVWGIRIPAWYCLSCSARPEDNRGEPKINPEVKSRWFLIRHGETDSNKLGPKGKIGENDDELNENGINQIKKALGELKNHKIDLIISSDMKRSKMTAEIIQKATGAEILFDEKLRERHFGNLYGMTREERDKKYGEIIKSYEGKPGNSESYKELEKRVWDTFSKHKENHSHKNIVIVSHGGPIRTIIKKIKNWSHENFIEHYAFPSHGQTIQMDVLESKCRKCGGHFYEQDSDVFDTWFSSGQWPFATLMANSKSQVASQKNDFKTFYPTDVMAPGYEILFFWVARMVMLGIYRTGKIPFKTVYLHGIVRDKDKQKMSKSKGNVVDPLGVIENYGTDALRFALLAGTGMGSDPIISEDKIRGYRNFATKIWNISRFILMNQARINADLHADKRGKNLVKFTATDRKNLAGAQKIKAKVAKHIERFEFHLAAETAYHYVWHTFADKIIEEYKQRLQKKSSIAFEEARAGAESSVFSEGKFSAPSGSVRPSPERTEYDSEKAIDDATAAYATLETILIECLKMLHPFMPFVTETIFRKFNPDKLLMVEEW